MEETLQQKLFEIQIRPLNRGIISECNRTNERAECLQVLFKHAALLVVNRFVGHLVELNFINKHAFLKYLYCLLYRS